MRSHPLSRPGAIRIRRITMREIRLPLVEPFRSAGGTVDARRVLLLELLDSDGALAWSECVAEATPSYAPDTVDTCWLAIAQWLAPRVLGTRFDRPRDVAPALGRDIRGHRMARAALEMGAWALAATKRGLPLAETLVQASAFAREQGIAAAAQVEAGIALGMQETPDRLVERARIALRVGYRRVKLKVAPGRDVDFVRAVREALGTGAPLSVDANCSYSLEDPSHVAALEALDALGLAMIEQPLGPDDHVQHAALQRRLATPVCLDETITGAASAADMIALGSGRMVNLKPGRVGGFAESLAIHDTCARAHVPVWCGGMLESGIGRAYNVALAALPGFTEPGDLSPSARYYARDIVRPAWTMDENGCVHVPLERPALGVDVDAGYIDDLTTRTLTLRAD